MNAYKDVLKDKDGNEFYPKTRTDNVYTPDGERLDNVIEQINTDLSDIGVFVELMQSDQNNTVVDIENIDNYRLLMFHIYDKINGAIYGGNMISPTVFKKYNTIANAFGFSGYNTVRIYGYINYVSNTQVRVQVANGYGVLLYGIK